MVESTEAQVVQTEDGQDLIVFNAPNDGTIAEVIDPSNIILNDGRLEYKKRHYHIVDSQGGVHSITMVGTEKLEQLFAIVNAQVSNLLEELTNANTKLDTASNIIMNSKRALLEMRRAVEQKQSENEKFKELYGVFVNPYLVLKELYKSGRVGRLRQLIKPEEFRQKSVNTKNKKNREPVQYWLSMFEYLNIADSEGNVLYAQVTYEKAKKILKKYLGETVMKNDIGYVGDNTTAGESLTEEEKAEITKELEEKMGGRDE